MMPVMLEDEIVDPLAPDNPLAEPLVNTLRNLVQVKQELHAALDECQSYRELSQLAIAESAAHLKELKAARATIERLRDEITSMRIGQAA